MRFSLCLNLSFPTVPFGHVASQEYGSLPCHDLPLGSEELEGADRIRDPLGINEEIIAF